MKLEHPKNTKKLIELLRLCNNRKVKYKVLGNGTNTLFSDKEFDGIIIKLDEFNDLTMEMIDEIIQNCADIEDTDSIYDACEKVLGTVKN